jgi:hypothetical protein
MNDQELLEFVDDETPALSVTLQPWRILVVDDDADVHESKAVRCNCCTRARGPTHWPCWRAKPTSP